MCVCDLVFYYILVVSLTQLVLRYTQNGILHMLERNKRIKTRPERFQNCKDQFDLVITCEERVYDQVLEGETDAQGLELKCNFAAPHVLFRNVNIFYGFTF